MRKIRLFTINCMLLFILSSTSTFVEAKEIKAKLVWFNITNLSFRVNGIVTDLFVKAGDIVRKKQKLVSLDQREFLDNVSSTKSLKKSRQSELEEAKRELDRATELYDRTVLSEHELQTAKNKYIASETLYVTAKKNWLKAKRNLEFSNILAPFDAIVLDVAINENETVISSFTSSTAIVIAEANKISAQFMLSAEDIIKLKSTGDDDAVEVIINGSGYKGKIYYPSLLDVDNLYPVAILLSIPFGIVHSGMDAIVNLD